jgi:hypothetical protein
MTVKDETIASLMITVASLALAMEALRHFSRTSRDPDVVERATETLTKIASLRERASF